MYKNSGVIMEVETLLGVCMEMEMFADRRCEIICSQSRETVEENLEMCRHEIERRGMKVSPSETKVQKKGRSWKGED